jgi:hypothetical protein
VQPTGRNSRPQQLVNATVLIVAAGLTLAGCGASGSGQSGRPSSPSVTRSGANGPSASSAVAGGAVEGDDLGRRMNEALVAAGGCTMQVTVNNTVAITGVLSFGSIVRASTISRTWGKGEITLADRRTARYVTDTGGEDEEFYINDGTLTEGRHWVQVPRAASQLRDALTLVKARPMVGFVPEFLPQMEAQNISIGLSGWEPVTAGHETVEGVAVTHYLWTFDGTSAKAGSPTTHEVWVDSQGRPVQYLMYAANQPFYVTYSHWGRQNVTAPDRQDTAVLPMVKP